VIVDECHRGSAAEDSAWREILEYFNSATQIGLTATPKETKDISNVDYFGDPIFTYSLRQGIADGFLAPYKVIRIDLDKDIDGWRPGPGQLDRYGQMIEDRMYNILDMDRSLVLDQRTKTVAWKITEYLKATDPFSKTIVFCEDVDHAERMRQALIMWNGEHVLKNHKYIMRITGDDTAGKAELDNFILPESKYPVIVTTSKLLNTGVDARTCKLIVLGQRIQSMTTFKQIIGRGTRFSRSTKRPGLPSWISKEQPVSSRTLISMVSLSRSIIPSQPNRLFRPIQKDRTPIPALFLHLQDPVLRNIMWTESPLESSGNAFNIWAAMAS